MISEEVEEEETQHPILNHTLVYSSSLQISDISTRRRLSTPKASPALPKRTSSQKSYKSSNTSEPSQPQKLGWFKSLDRLSRKKDKTSTLPPSSRTSSVVDDRLNGHNSHTLKATRGSSHQESPVKGNSSKTLRFFGDTDLESNGSYSKASWKNK